jgi:hypothetical protein
MPGAGQYSSVTSGNALDPQGVWRLDHTASHRARQVFAGVVLDAGYRWLPRHCYETRGEALKKENALNHRDDKQAPEGIEGAAIGTQRVSSAQALAIGVEKNVAVGVIEAI